MARSRRLPIPVFILLLVLLPAPLRADINPWIAPSVFNPEKWDTAGPQTATPWLHPPPYNPGQGWGMLGFSRAVKDGHWQEFTNLTGSWGGSRDELMERGVAFSVAYFGQFAANLVGGAVQGGLSWRGDLAVGGFLDLERVVGLERTYFIASFDWKDGSASLTNQYVKNQFPIQLDNGDDRYHATRLVYLALGRQLLHNAAEIVAGRVITGDEFATLRLACTSLNQAICANPIGAAQSISFPTYPSAVWGGHFKLKPGSSWLAKVGSYLVYPDFRNPSAHGVDFSAPQGAGALTLAEFAYFTGDGDSGGLPGQYKIGGYYDTEELKDLDKQTPTWCTGGGYLMGQQMIFAEDAKGVEGLSAWFSVSFAPPERNLIPFMAAGGLSYQGIIPDRPWDALSFIAAYGSYSSDLRSGQRARGEPVQYGEVLLEINYRYAPASWLWFEPDIQGILQPDGRTDIPDAFTIGFALGLVL